MGLHRHSVVQVQRAACLKSKCAYGVWTSGKAAGCYPAERRFDPCYLSVLDVIRIVDVDRDGYRQEDGSIKLIYTWYCHLHPEEIGSLFMLGTEVEAAEAALAHIRQCHGDGRSPVS